MKKEIFALFVASVLGACDGENGRVDFDGRLDGFSIDSSVLDSSPIDASVDVTLDLAPQDSANQDSTLANDSMVGDASNPTLRAEMNDLSILWPLGGPETDMPHYLRASSEGDRGRLYPEALHERVLATNLAVCRGELPGARPECIDYDKIIVVALRIDPCFADLEPDPHGNSCRPQLRLIAQAARTNFDGHLVVGDAALHFFYDLTRADFEELASKLVNLRVAHSSANESLGALAIHPILRRQGLAGGFSAGLREIVLRYAGSSNLSRVALMTIPAVMTDAWEFSQFDIVNGEPLASVIPTASNPNKQSFDISQDPTNNGHTTHADSIAVLLVAEELGRSSPEQRGRAVVSTRRLENPSIHSPETIDCVSCHLAQPGREALFDRNFFEGGDDSSQTFVPDIEYVSALEGTAQQVPVQANIVSSAPTRLAHLHAFSYRRADAHINQRTVNETAAVVSYVNRYIFQSP